MSLEFAHRYFEKAEFREIRRIELWTVIKSDATFTPGMCHTFENALISGS